MAEQGVEGYLTGLAPFLITDEQGEHLCKERVHSEERDGIQDTII